MVFLGIMALVSLVLSLFLISELFVKNHIIESLKVCASNSNHIINKKNETIRKLRYDVKIQKVNLVLMMTTKVGYVPRLDKVITLDEVQIIGDL